ncbi:MAG: HAD hydrolase family protein [Deltaproteobacteria bacterium]|nr:HAD hydrolase family protein [Deltaproteobacteria bacterium]
MAYDMMDAIERAKRVKLVVLDVHGVLTNGMVLFNEDGVKFQVFHHDDGFGANVLMMSGIEVALLTRKSKIVFARAQEVGIKRVYAAKEKWAKMEEIMAEIGIGPDEVCYVGDEIIDLGAMRRVGFAVCPANGVPEVRDAAHLITRRAGGEGMLRELAEFILRAQGRWGALVEKIANMGWG